MRVDRPSKALRRRPAAENENDRQNSTAGASGETAPKPRRPGRTASLLSAGDNLRSQKWRNPTKGAPDRRRGVLAKGSRTRPSGSRKRG